MCHGHNQFKGAPHQIILLYLCLYLQPVTLALLRSDYMMDTKQGEVTNIKQVEINTMASSMAGHMSKVALMHR